MESAPGNAPQLQGSGKTGHLNRDELLAFLNEMLEAERAGAKTLLRIARETKRSNLASLAQAVHMDEAHWCDVLTRAIRKLNGEPSPKTGQFYGKVMALSGESERLALVNRGQGWVVKKLRETLPKLADTDLAETLSAMLVSHEKNIATVDRSGLID
jgi:nitronate monooxygenase